MHTGQWAPRPYEVKFGSAFLTLSKELDGAPAVNGLPPEEHPFDRRLVHHLTMPARLVRTVQSRLLPASPLRFRLRRSPMRRLAAAYVEAGQGLLPYAERILHAWEHTPPVLDVARLEEYTSRSGLPADEARDRIWRETVKEWERAQLADDQRAALDEAERPMSQAATIMVAAVTGETSY
ncbi:hypothetical protein [Streptomyces graminilatus]|uniref:hypothetical protein n=1 Tax=Streptomyces graminilatus TaxID=1464070 RepID=UPI0006E125A7|nr:hypothetical protein [Streptomyces graminilatus]